MRHFFYKEIKTFWIAGKVHLVSQRHHDSEGNVFPLLDVRVDDISNEQIEEEEGHEAGGHSQRQPPLREQPQGEVLQLPGCRQRPSV